LDTKADNPIHLLPDQVSEAVVRAYFELCHLKQLFRQGWLRRGLPRERCESVAEHSFGVALLALWLSSHFPELDLLRLVSMALVHDFGEVYAGDIVPGDEVTAQEKYRREYDSVQRVFGALPDGERYIDLWLEFEEGLSKEALFLRQLDRLEMGLQASVYQRQGFPGMGEFQASAFQALQEPRLVELLQAATGDS
jgi:putative hydrolase of HD superfamily